MKKASVILRIVWNVTRADMNKIISRWGLMLLPIFILALITAGFFALQIKNSSPQQPADFLAADKGYGVTIDLTGYSDSELADTLISLRENGLTWIRQPINWAEIEPKPGQFDWRQLDRVFSAVVAENEKRANNQQQFKIIAVLHASPVWAKPTDTPPATPPTEVSDFGHFVRSFTARYGQQIDYYQIWHEPNIRANWNSIFISPAAYVKLLREAALNIHALDNKAYIITAALAPTLEENLLNFKEAAYLEQLYQAKANRWFDIVAVQPYGFDREPSQAANSDILNFRRIELIHQVMLKHGDSDTPIWATAFGWNALPPDWSGYPTAWKSNTLLVQTERTAAGIQYARQNWPWLGPMLAIRWDTNNLAEDNPLRGFALLETAPILETIRNSAQKKATPGSYPASHNSGQYSPGWRFAGNTADIPHDAPRTLTINFEGTQLDLMVNRGPFRGYLWVTIDGQPANALPRDEQGRSYVVLYDPLRNSETITLSENLAEGQHTAVIEAEGGWGQWAIGGWMVRKEVDTRPFQTELLIAGIVTTLSGFGLLWWVLGSAQLLLEFVWIWGRKSDDLYAKLGEYRHIIITFTLAVGFYLSPPLVSLAMLPFLSLAIILRPDLGLAVIAFSLSFFQAAKQLPFGSFSPVELALAITFAAVIFRLIVSQFPTLNSQLSLNDIKSKLGHLKSTDWAALAFALLALIATLTAYNFGVSMHEWRVVVAESVLFYFLVRLGLDFSPTPTQNDSWRWAWRLIDAFIAGAVLQASTALYLYFFADKSITAEGVYRVLGAVYGSPNNLSLFLGRAWPILLAVTVLPGIIYRRLLYGVALIIVSITLYLTFSKGSILIGIPLSVVFMALLYILRNKGRSWQRVVKVTAGGLGLIILALIPLVRTARFNTLFDFRPGSTVFFRLKLWQASIKMLGDYWLTGVGLDNFLYKYRTLYILPEAWQEPNLNHPHNLFLDFGTRLGIGGIAVLLWLQIAFWSKAWQLYKRTSSPLILGLMGSMILSLGHGLVDNSYFLVDLAFILFLTLGVNERVSESARGLE